MQTIKANQVHNLMSILSRMGRDLVDAMNAITTLGSIAIFAQEQKGQLLRVIHAHRSLHASSVPDFNSHCHCLALVLQQLSIYATQAQASFIICAFIFICKVQIALTTMNKEGNPNGKLRNAADMSKGLTTPPPLFELLYAFNVFVPTPRRPNIIHMRTTIFLEWGAHACAYPCMRARLALPHWRVMHHLARTGRAYSVLLLETTVAMLAQAGFCPSRVL